MIKLIEAYYKAWETNDKKLLEDILHPDFYGLRTYDKELFFTNEDVSSHFTTNTIDTVVFNSYKFQNDDYNLELTINGKSVLSKIIIKDKRIYKVYETVETTQRRIKCVCSYDGSPFSGYQKQLNVTTIQGTIEDALSKIFKKDLTIHSSGRTDKGVHALNQVFHFDIESSIETENIKKVLNSYLPDSIYIKTIEEVDFTFHSRYDVKVKTYQYVINLGEYCPIKRNYEWTVESLDLQKFDENLKSIIGTHDFTSFTKKTDQDTIRTIYNATSKVKDNHLIITIEGNGFMRYMVRNIIGSLVSINKGKLKFSIEELINMKDINLIKNIAPSCGLYLYSVTY